MSEKISMILSSKLVNAENFSFSINQIFLSCVGAKREERNEKIVGSERGKENLFAITFYPRVSRDNYQFDEKKKTLFVSFKARSPSE